MAEQEYFKRALSNFTYDVASGGAIRHLTDVGYTVKQIMENLSYPTPYERVQRTVWEHLLNTGVILLEEPGINARRETVSYVKEYNKYGKASFRRVTTQQGEKREILFREYPYTESKHGKLADFLFQKCADNGEKEAYISYKFGLYFKNPEQRKRMLDLLENNQRDYIEGLPWKSILLENIPLENIPLENIQGDFFPWEKKLCYHRLDQRMREIVVKWHSDCDYHECCYFLKTSEKVYL